jgi:hypothetical protein
MCRKANKISPDKIGAYFIIGIIEVNISMLNELSSIAQGERSI